MRKRVNLMSDSDSMGSKTPSTYFTPILSPQGKAGEGPGTWGRCQGPGKEGGRAKILKSLGKPEA